MKTKHLLLIALAISMFTFTYGQTNGPIKVELKKEGDTYTLYRDGKPYIIKGAGCEFGNIASVAKYGGNSIRTWRVDNGKQTGEQVLDEAAKYGLTVHMGLEIARERHGFNYNDTAAVAKQKEQVRTEILRLRNHPALLAWGIGNELNLRYTNPKVWDAVNDIAKMIHQIDPNHPVTTMLAGIDKATVDQIKQRCPDLDYLSVQMYGSLINLPSELKKSEWNGPYIVSEWGATGHWEVKTTSWKAPIEQTSSEKAAAIMERYEKAIKVDPQHCIGNYVFVWEQKQERTPTWYGLFTENNKATQPVDVMSFIWVGQWPANRCPQVSSPILNGKTAYDNITLKPEGKIAASIDAKDADNDALTYTWEILPESTDLGDGGDHESRPQTLFNETSKTNSFQLKAPKKSGAYRLFIYVDDNHNNVGTANIPFLVSE